jgi:hypothetical protein
MNPEAAHPVRHRRSVWKWLLLMAVLLIAAVVLLAPQVIRNTGRYGDKFNRAVMNMRMIGLALTQFEADYGSHPNDLTRAEVLQQNPESRIQLGTSSANDYFHQLLAAGIVDTPTCFHGYGISNRKASELPDAVTPLPPGTCGFAYIIADGESKVPSTPLVVYPLVRGKFIFDRKLCRLRGNRAVVLYADSSIRLHPIDSSGRLMIDGLDLFDPAQAHWQGRGFQVKWPD